MKDKLKNVIVTFTFLLLIIGNMVANIVTPDNVLSFSERRILKTFPTLTIDNILSGEFFTHLEEYSLDQFILRDSFRTVKAFTKFFIFNQKDNNDIYLIDDGIYKLEYPLNEKSLLNAAKKLNEIANKYENNGNIYCSIIPDKNYFVANQNGYLAIDYQLMVNIMKENLTDLKYINLFNTLEINDYYRTDIHWRQENLFKTANKLLHEMGNDIDLTTIEYQQKDMFPFYGSYYGQSAFPIYPDTLTYLVNSMIINATVYDYERNTTIKVYNTELFSSIDPYNLYLEGPKPLLTITNPSSTSQKKLVIYRDSFASSIAPLLLESYSKITLVDLRYISSSLLNNYIDFSEETDVLFLYSTSLLNNSFMLK